MKARVLQVVICLLVFPSLHALATVYDVDLNCTNPTPPYAAWSTAATNIQDAISLAGSGDTVLVTNGVYQSGGCLSSGSNRVYVVNNVMVQSVNGPAVTTIMGRQVPGTTNGISAMRCVYLASGATLSGFTLTNGATQSSGNGGGIVSESNCTITNCVIAGNAASGNGGGAYLDNSSILINCEIIGNVANAAGGGVYGGILINCIVMNNAAGNGGGVASSAANNCLLAGNGNTNSVGGTAGGASYLGTLNNCTLVGNFSRILGAADGSTLNNSIIYYNFNSGYPDCYQCRLTNCCTPSLVNNSSPVNSFTNPPGFLDLAGGNYHLQIGSPCIDAGNDTFITSGADLDGNPRIVGGAVDLGAYENQNTNTVHYASLTGTNPVTPYTNWTTAATNIQDAVSVAQPGEFVVAGAGTYTNGGTLIYGSETNRVALTNAITLLSLNGPKMTAIVGGGQMRCVYVGSNSILSGFTITNGHGRTSGHLTNEQSGGGIWCEPGGSAVNCLVVSNYANFPGTYSGGYGGGVYGGTISNCTLTGNTAGSGGGAGGPGALWNCTLANNTANGGGGAYRTALYNCVLSNNTAVYNGNSGIGGGVDQCMLYNGTLTGNQASGNGGGAYQGTNFNGLITGNAAGAGGGTYQSTNFDCLISGNAVSIGGGGAYGGLLYNCVLSGNTATNSISIDGNGGGLYSATTVNCTVTGNSATGAGGGMYGGTAYNSIIYFNSAPGGANWTNSPLMYYCCTTPLPSGGSGNITSDPSFVDAAGGDLRLQCGSPCIDAGFTNAIIFAATNDIRGVTRPVDGNGDSLARFDLGAYEYNPAIDQTPAIRVAFTFANFATGYTVPFVAEIGGCADYFWWDFGDGTAVTNQYNVSHAWAAPGTFTVRLSAYYSSQGQTLSATTGVQVVQPPIYYVNASNTTPVAPYTNWTTAATGIQPAVAAGVTPGRLVLVTNGLYQGMGVTVNGLLLNCVALTNAVLVQSVNGAPVTMIKPIYVSGERCGYIGSNAVLSGFTLTGGGTSSSGDTNNDQSGGGVWCEPGGVVSNCVVAGCRADYFGGGAFQGTFFNCTFSNNQVSAGGPTARGGAAYQAVLYNCNLISNKVSSPFPGGKGGGSYGGALFNCTLTGNSVDNGDLAGTGGGACLGTLYNCALIGNSGSGYGGGSCSNTLWNCVLSGNWANNGGGTFAGVLYNCLVTSNTAASNGGGAYSGTFYNCTVAGNTAQTGGGIYWTFSAYNSIIYDNTTSAGGGVDNWDGNILRGSYNCIFPQFLPASGGNITNDPAFANPAGGDFHLQSNSPCINSGNNVYVTTATDSDGNPRIAGGTVDIGAYEFQNPASVLSYAWLQQYGLPTDGSADYADSDGDGFNNWQEWIAGTNPTNALSVLQMLPPAATNNPTGLVVSWQSVDNITYFLQSSTNLGMQPAFSTIQSNIIGHAGTTSYTDTTATNNGPYFYRVGVQ